jgi:hypothetical protein
MSDWDRTRNWMVHCTRHDRLRLVLTWDSGRPSTRELLALRKLCPEYGESSGRRVRRQDDEMIAAGHKVEYSEEG